MSRFRPVGVLTKSSTGKTLRLEIHPLPDVLKRYYYVYPEATQKVISGKKKSATIYAIEEWKGAEHIRYVCKHIENREKKLVIIL